MAAGPSQAVSSSHSLGEDDLVWVHQALYPVRAQYTYLGLLIGVKKTEIDDITAEQTNSGMRLLEILSVRLKQTPALTWDIIDKALRSPTIGELLLADTLQKTCGKGCDPSLSHPGFESTLDQQPRQKGKKYKKEFEMHASTRQLSSTSEEYSDEEVEKGLKRSSSASLAERSSPVERKRSDHRNRCGNEIEKWSLSSSTEMDESSPECNVLKKLSESETQKLRQIFKCSFGKLCCNITEPVQTAAELQEKRLVSLSTMKYMVASPESQQIKTIALVHDLYRKIKSRSDRIFTVIEIFLKNEALHEVGRKLWLETGKLCPERTAFFFGSELPPPSPGGQQTVQPSSTTGMMVPVSASAATQDVTGEYISPPEAVRVSVSQPVLTQYGEYLRSCYRARPLAAADKYLPTLNAPYINLAMVCKEYYGPNQRDEFTRQTLHGGVDQILRTKKPIKIEDLLTPEDSGRPVRFILVEGPPGIGKSTFVWEVCRRWDEIESLREYHTVVLLKFREKWVLNATKLSDLFRFPPQPELSTDIAKALNETHGQNLLLVLDGFDEVSHEVYKKYSVIESILLKQLLPECTIILTTRPSANYTLRSIWQPQVDKHVEIIGFTERQRVKYITEVFSKEPELQANFLKYMFLVPDIKSMMYIPLNCAIIAQVYYESQKSHFLTIPRTTTQLYKALTHSILVRHIKNKENQQHYISMLPEGLEQDDMVTFKTLAEFAFDTYHKEELRKVIFFRKDVPEGLNHLGFMNESTDMYADKGVEQTFSFLHLSLQVYLAAWYMANELSIEFQVAYHGLHLGVCKAYKGVCIKEEELISSLSSLNQPDELLVEPAVFLAGITGWRSRSVFDENHWEIYLTHDTAGVSGEGKLLRSLYEAQNPAIIPHYFAAETRALAIHSHSSPSDCYALPYCLAHSSSDQVSLAINFSNEDDIKLAEIFAKGLDDHCKLNTPSIQHLAINLKTDSIKTFEQCLYFLTKPKFLANIEELYIVFKTAPTPAFLESLVKLQSLEITIVDFPTSWEWLCPIRSLTELNLLRIFSKMECIPPAIDPYCLPVGQRLTELGLDIQLPFTNTHELHSETDVLLDSVLRSLVKSNRIVIPNKIVIYNISHKTMAAIRNILLHCPSLETLELKRTRLGYDGILYICSALKNNKSLKHLVIHDQFKLLPPRNTIEFTSFSTMEVIPLPGKINCTDFLLELNNILKDNTTLEEMKIQSGLFLPLSAGEDGEYCQWTGLGPLQQFNVGAVGSGMSPNLRRSFSSSDLTQPQTTVFWGKQYRCFTSQKVHVDFKKLFSKRNEERKNSFSISSFTAPNTQVLQSFSSLDLRLKECLGISHLHEYLERVRETCWGMLKEISDYNIEDFDASSWSR